ncbi:dentin sialophosphoprotein [Ceratitis capitata]|uniref:dentin sialophosphoprotein n=1 Tax=Ceratitis capitata TaxID=7213 RepID=UPI00032A3894|nr:dentin sialophosphoprotein [Ceratitis capitata]XP_004531129.1 dentin sialophosphoprotein [Ceratitis capitata]XP_012159604.1 dentin sialophosphoprotein [Ceratitis capitata]XP_012159605.1 dentin sialophosphoprotein [Ceratitis capitata]
MTSNKDTASFFENGTTHQFEYCYKLYPQVLKLKAEKRNKKPQELIRLDEWYQNELPKLIKARGKDAHMVYDELVQTMKWKQSRGKFYPQLSYLVKVNTPRAVMQETKKAFRKLPNLEQAITALSNLKGVGTTMASALLAAAAPDSAPFMADECLMAIPEIEGIDYTTKEYLNFVQHIQTTVARLNTEAGGETPHWSPHRVELALWAHYVANDLSPELLDEMPGPGAGGGANTNGSTVKAAAPVAKVLGGEGEDTNDEESLGAADNDHNNTTAIVTAPTALQDGDSNFVSNDSTSQEPIIDENTTQTTATTSTDDGEVGTPLASDSESNLEAPEKAKLKHNNSNSSIIANINSNSDIIGIAHSVVGDNSNNCRQKAVDDALVGNSNGNGNGTLVSSGAPISDGENSSCIRSTGNEEASEEDDVDAEDESSNSNSRHIGQSHKSITPLFGSNLNDSTNCTNTNVSDSNNDSTLSSGAAGIVSQKRALHCADVGSEVVDGILMADEADSQPEPKKIRGE